MNSARYRALCRYAGTWLATPVEKSFPIDAIGEIRATSGIYIVCEALERVQYVGSVHRPASYAGVADRLREHLRDAEKRLAWKSVWVVPLALDVPRSVVRSIEACVGVDLAPLVENRLPRL
jgi:hypothetical protein